MSDIKETVLLKFEIDQGQAAKQLAEINKSILNTKESQTELTKAYKAGLVSQDQYVKENIVLTQQLTKQQQQAKTLTQTINTESNSRNALKIKVSQLTKEYDNLNTSTVQGVKRQKELETELTSLNNEISKTSKSAGLFKDQIGNYPHSFGEAAKEIDIAGVSVGSIGEKLTSFANPATVAVAIVGALGAAYARSTVGAKDLEFVQNQLGEATTILTNKFAELFSSAEDGEGTLTKLLNASLSFVANGTVLGNALKLVGLDLNKVAKDSRDAAINLEKLEDLERELLDVRGQNNERLETNQELLTDINDATIEYVQKVDDANKIIENVKINRQGLLDIEKQELKILQDALDLGKTNEVRQRAVKEKVLEISQINRDGTKQIERTKKLLDNINEAEAKRIELQKQKIAIFTQEAKNFIKEADNRANEQLNTNPFQNEVNQSTQAQDTATGRPKNDQFDVAARAKSEKDFNSVLEEVIGKDRAKIYEDDATLSININKAKKRADSDYLGSLANSTNQLAGLFKKGSVEQKAFALESILLNEAKAIAGLTASSAENPTNAVTFGAAGIAQYAAGIVEIISNIAAALEIVNSFADGGYTGAGGKYQVAGVVHAGEYVVPQNVNYSPAAQPHIQALEGMRQGYSDGGFVANKNTYDSNNAMIIANSFKNLPPIYTSVKEISLAQNKVQVKQNISTL